MKRKALLAAIAASLLLAACGDADTDSASKAESPAANETVSSQEASEGAAEPEETAEPESAAESESENEGGTSEEEPRLDDYLDEEEALKYTAENGKIKVWLPTKITASDWEEGAYETVTYDEKGLPVRWDAYGEYWFGEGKEYGVAMSFIYKFNDDYTLNSLTREHRDENYTEPLAEDYTGRNEVVVDKTEKTELSHGSPVEYTDNGLVKQFVITEDRIVTIEYNEDNRPISIFTVRPKNEDYNYASGTLLLLAYNDDGLVNHIERINNGACPTEEDWRAKYSDSSSSMVEYNGWYIADHYLDEKNNYDFTYDENGRVVKETEYHIYEGETITTDRNYEYEEFEVDENYWEAYRNNCLYNIIDPRDFEGGSTGSDVGYSQANCIYSYINNGCYQNFLQHFIKEDEK